MSLISWNYKISSFLSSFAQAKFATMSAATTDYSARTYPRVLALFDVDGTLTIPRGEVTDDMMNFMKELSSHVVVGIVGGMYSLYRCHSPWKWNFFCSILYFLFKGSDLPKQEEQLGEGIVKVFPYNFSQNGLVAYKNGELLNVQTMAKHIGEANVKRIVNWTLRYVADLDIPIKVSLSLPFQCGLMYSFFPSWSHAILL